MTAFISSTEYDMISIDDECVLTAYQQSQFNPDDNIIFCQTFESNDYSQVFMIGLIMYLIYLGMFLLPFSQYLSYAKAITEARSTITTTEGVQNLRLTMDESNERDLNLGRFKGIPFILYLSLHSLLSIIYLAIKIILIIHPFNDNNNNNNNDNRYKFVNDRFLDFGFKQFVNGETIILTCLLTHNISNIWKLTMIYKYKQGFYVSICKKILCIIALGFIWLDFVGSIGMLCYFWSLGIFFLYEIAVSIIVAFILILSCCFTVPCFVCLILLNIGLF